ncbi:hypothetical protein [Erythrobacter alti]|uniref:hypothetical protein n=1 Tax=Erythrobacter alti TaxID=1896145 RepID=UPI0030F4474E
MSLAVVEEEVRRFLSDPAPEVLCIKGKWGVGKTFGWRTFLRKARDDEKLAMSRYAYVSLFGLNSLDDLRYALFERTVTGDAIGEDPNPETFRKMVADRDTGRKLKPLIDGALAFFNRQGISDLLAKAAVLTVRNQLICFDDLERAGNGLGTREILGLASLLKEERHCKVVLLLNDQEHDEEDEFTRQLEKVADVTLTFEPTAAEAATIALDSASPVFELLHPRFVELGITNIRVIRKIERLAGRLLKLLEPYDPKIAKGAIATLVLASWSVQQPKLGPPIEYLRNYSSLSVHFHFAKDEKDPDFEAFEALIRDYPFKFADDLDLVVIDGAEAGYFIEESVSQAAQRAQEELKRNSRENALSRAWEDLYHGSLSADDDEFLDAVHSGALKDAQFTSASNINSAIYILCETGRQEQAREVLAAYMAAKKDEQPEFFDLSSHFLGGDKVEDMLFEAFEKARGNYVDSRDPFDVLKQIGAERSWSERDLMLMANQSADDFERMFEALKGKEIRHSIETLQRMGRSQREGSKQIAETITKALKRIGAKSPLRARKVARFGVKIEEDGSGDKAT